MNELIIQKSSSGSIDTVILNGNAVSILSVTEQLKNGKLEASITFECNQVILQAIEEQP